MKKRISSFEFAIMETLTPEEAKNYEPYTSEEESQQRRDNVKRQMNKLKPI